MAAHHPQLASILHEYSANLQNIGIELSHIAKI
jgi:hypothetical protein